MVFGHRFDFRNELSLQEEYLSFPTQISQYSYNQTIKVIESSKSSLSDIFTLKTDWFSMSGQEARYCSMIPFEEAVKEFSWALEIKNVVTLMWDASNKKIIYSKGKNYTPIRLQFWVFHTFFPIVLELEYIYRILHVGSVEIEGKPVLFSAFSFGGKSTLTDYFIKKGHTMLSDDSVAIDKRGDEYYAIASYPFHRPSREFETLGYSVKNFATEPKPLHAIYVLEKSEPDAIIEINELKGIVKFKALNYSSFIDFSIMKKRHFDFFTEMVKHIPVYRVVIPWDLKRLSEVYQMIIKHSQLL